MKKLSSYIIMLLLFSELTYSQAKQSPTNFVFLSSIDPTIIEYSRYFSSENFLGRKVPGYVSPKIICTMEAALALKAVQADLKNNGYKLVVYDGYRPQRSSNAFVGWSEDLGDQVAKKLYYPTLDKRDLFKLGYVGEKSSHSRGSTFDLTIIPIDQNLQDIKVKAWTLTNGEVVPFLDDNTVDMGTSFDLFHQSSHHDSALVTAAQSDKRNFLREIMKKHGFQCYEKEWWHYTLENEPYPDTYFDF